MADLLELIDRMLGPDADGRITGAGPHLYVFRTADDVLCRCHADLAVDIAQSLRRIARAERGRQRDWPRDYGGYLRELAPVGRVEAMRAAMLYRVTDPPSAAAVRITPANADLLRGGLDEWLPDVEAGRLIYASVEGARAVALCTSVTAVDGAHAAGVETLPSHRRRGLAADAVAGWASAVRGMGATPFYGTTFDNLASQGVARRLSMQLVGSEFWVRCSPPA